MPLPKQVQQQADAVAEFEKKLAEQNTPPADPENPPSPEPAPIPAAETPPSNPAPAPIEPVRDDGQWEQKYRTLQGMFTRETQQARVVVQTQSQQIADLTAEVAAMRKSPPAPSSPLVTEEDNTKFGADLVDMARRVAQQEFAPREQALNAVIAELRTQLGQQVGQVQQTQHDTQREGFFSRLVAAVPDWEQIQETPACQTWLSARVPGSTFTWNDVLLDAAGKFDSARAIEVYSTFKSTLPPPATPAPSRRPDLSRQISPSKSTASAPTPGGEKRIYSGADYAAESQQVIRLMKAGHVDEANRIQAQLDAALSEGRITP